MNKYFDTLIFPRRSIYTGIVVRLLAAICFMSCLLTAQQPPAPKKPATPPAAKEEEPPEEDESLKPKEYTLNPLEAERNLNAGNFYFKKSNYSAAARRFEEASKWDPGSAEAFLKLGEADEKLRNRDGAREAYTKYLELAPAAKNAAEIKKKLAKFPQQPQRK
jgi:tetratricopeptide (TPR) repeat protein